MAKRSSDGDVLSNMLAVREAESRRQIESLLSGQSHERPSNEPSRVESDEQDLKDKYVDDESFGVGALVPEEIEDGTFTRRIPGSTNDKLLQQLLGKKAAKAHLERQQISKNVTAKLQTQSKSQRKVVKNESEDEEEGRASAFVSKRRKVVKPNPANDDAEEMDDEAAKLSLRNHEGEGVEVSKKGGQDSGSDVQAQRKANAKSRPQKVKKGSYLDELLAERSKRKKNKSTFKI